MKAYFSRLVPYYIIEGDEVTDTLSFDAYPVEVDPAIVEFAKAARAVVNDMQAVFDSNPAPEECAQAEADAFADIVVSRCGAANKTLDAIDG